jgi:arylformamidase
MSPSPDPVEPRWIRDVSAPLRAGMVSWPGDEATFERRVEASLDAGDAMTVSHLLLGSHTGTHVDAPSHFLAGAGGVETVPLPALVGPAFVVDVPADASMISADVLDAAGVPVGATRLLARTRNSGWSRGEAFDEGYVAFDETAADWCLRRGLVLVGIDYLSIEPFDADRRGYPVHRALLGAGVVVLEGLDLDDVPPGAYDLVALPLLVPGSDGAPARALLSRPAGVQELTARGGT